MRILTSTRLRAGTALALALSLVPVQPLAAQEDGPGGHRKWMYALVGGLVAGVPAAFSNAYFDTGGGGCTKPECFAPIAAAVGATVGLLIGIERDEAAARRHVAGPDTELSARMVELPLEPTGILPFRGGALAVGREGIAVVDESMSVLPVRGVRGLNTATVLGDHNLVVAASSGALFGFDMGSRVSRARRLYSEGAPALTSDGASRVLFGGIGSLRVLRAEGMGTDASLTEEVRASTPDVASDMSWSEEGEVVWVLSRERLEARKAGTLEEVGRLVLPTAPLSVAVDGDLAVAAAGEAGVYVLDLSEPGSPRLVGRYDGVSFARDAAIRGTRAWVAAGDQGLVSLDLGTPSAPAVTGVVRNLGRPTAVIVNEGGLFVLDRESRELRRVSLEEESGSGS